MNSILDKISNFIPFSQSSRSSSRRESASTLVPKGQAEGTVPWRSLVCHYTRRHELLLRFLESLESLSTFHFACHILANRYGLAFERVSATLLYLKSFSWNVCLYDNLMMTTAWIIYMKLIWVIFNMKQDMDESNLIWSSCMCMYTYISMSVYLCTSAGMGMVNDCVLLALHGYL